MTKKKKKVIALRLLALFAILGTKWCYFMGRGPGVVEDWGLPWGEWLLVASEAKHTQLKNRLHAEKTLKLKAYNNIKPVSVPCSWISCGICEASSHLSLISRFAGKISAYKISCCPRHICDSCRTNRGNYWVVWEVGLQPGGSDSLRWGAQFW